MKIGIDMDGVILDTYTDWLAKFNAEHGYEFDINSLSDYNFSIPMGLDRFILKNSIIEFCNNHIPRTNPDAISVLKQLAINHELFIITARIPTQHDITRKIINDLGVKFSGVYFSMNKFNQKITSNKTKLDICKEIGCDLIIEDNPHEIEKFNENMILVYDQPWNRHIPNSGNAIRVHGWMDILNHINLLQCRKEL